MPWVIVPKPRRRWSLPLARLRSDRERMTRWTAAGLGFFALLAFWFAVAHKLA